MDATLLKVGYIINVEMARGDSIWGRVVAVRPAAGEGYLVDYVTRSGTQRTINPTTTNLAHAFYNRGKRIRRL